MTVSGALGRQVGPGTAFSKALGRSGWPWNGGFGGLCRPGTPEKDAQEGPEPPRGEQNRPQVASESGKNRKIIARLRRDAHSGRVSIDFR